ncbi:CAMK/CAMK1 protein kinase, variant 2 [Phytophthora nicotianae P10297]|nr:CAMK/CAMK1 protein kinase, variant 2 [Phytophthora nicotianae INRA-310]ETI35877.1 CAMK/CAMK1 protein kinase, variant 2 [Phytophthora nicotianae P1569]ETK76140.1 CAMK/CAMK1 protein kinase, variant 2 [Phytophthora nicotianae]ETO64589.1 CAMK/CAMK1 protein kinase, variant 2 [Phytophthora nicotianae P1976]ETP33818.1 CAMK/CAMK1 protein kinase, variant 2 [Phytophthora nicotianae P10297]ETL29586.1 CAMK/CAMK1 protein kinase, variant 2 [Phytophthora nicotianae]
MESKYEMLDEIGHGGTSVVYKCCERRTGVVRACKIIDRRAVEREHNVVMEQFQVEIQVLQSLKHPNIIHIEDVFLSESKICMVRICIPKNERVTQYSMLDALFQVTEYMGGGELFDYVVDRGTLSEVEASTIVRQITSAVAYLHARGIIHRDLKPENLMLTSKSRGASVKIIDFGLAKLLDADDKTASFLGTRGYLAPEMLQRQAYSMSVDMWALGIIVYVLLCGCLPFDDDGGKIANEKAARAKFGLRFPRWASGLSESAKDLLRNLLEVDSTNRFTAEQALAHPWVTGARTPNKYLKSPNYLRSIKQEKVSQKMNGRMPHANGNSVEVCNGNGPTISVRRQSR